MNGRPRSGTWTTQADRLQFGTTTSVALDGVFDNVRLDVGSMPPAGAAPGGLILARAPFAPRVLGDAPVIAARPLLDPPPVTEIVTKTYYYAGSSLIAMRVLTGTTGNTLYYLHADHLGSTSLTTSDTGAVVARQYYYPYGGIRPGPNNALPTDITFTGQRSESGLGSLMYFRARFYSPLVGRFLSADTIVPGAYNPQNLNRFAYSLNNPVRYNDPSGHCIWDLCIVEGIGRTFAYAGEQAGTHG